MWLNGTPILLDDKQVAEVIRQGNTYLIRNLRPNGTVGICFDSTDKTDITTFLTNLYGPGWTKGGRNASAS